ncbi:hypothetical protein JCM39194_25690 [Desulfotomaculum varum]
MEKVLSQILEELKSLNQRVNNMEQGQQQFKEEVLLNRREIIDKLDSLDSSLIYLANKFTQHDMQLFDMKRRVK